MDFVRSADFGQGSPRLRRIHCVVPVSHTLTQHTAHSSSRAKRTERNTVACEFSSSGRKRKRAHTHTTQCSSAAPSRKRTDEQQQPGGSKVGRPSGRSIRGPAKVSAAQPITAARISLADSSTAVASTSASASSLRPRALFWRVGSVWLHLPEAQVQPQE